ncbi:MAG TPA: hypothetical protein VM344_10580 [Vitreimonas sp.]|nr:hypothetical protein [Vitreimonas sp.]
MDPLLPRKPQDIDRWSDEAERDAPAEPTTGPGDRWVNETARQDPDYPADPAGGGGVEPLNERLEDDGTIGDQTADDPTIRGQAR